MLASSRTPSRREARVKDPAIDEYLAKVPPRSRALLQHLRKTIHALVPEVQEFDEPLPRALVRKLLDARIAEGKRR
jgi:hypothetical protein